MITACPPEYPILFSRTDGPADQRGDRAPVAARRLRGAGREDEAADLPGPDRSAQVGSWPALSPALAVPGEELWRLRSAQGDDELVFMSGRGHVLNTANLMSRILKPAAVAAGVWLVTASNGKTSSSGPSCESHARGDVNAAGGRRSCAPPATTTAGAFGGCNAATPAPHTATSMTPPEREERRDDGGRAAIVGEANPSGRRLSRGSGQLPSGRRRADRRRRVMYDSNEHE